ncbi:hypothetical protein HO133_000880 [Letharia lupina]|uniref:DUF3074 domain-containing protein n=1 Tax=Letharia lupina TaxID=560253 RepID=A0A8H6FCI3_9LECA|nr:uncharacterized protein HO133_000880 [Letharia lupina]KAF6222829.1 hypothetical protein HO133_000880 [Letharia lupina]
MAALHSALQSLSPTPFSSVPTAESETISYLQNAFTEAQTIIDSVPLPPPNDPLVSTRPRSSTSASIASNVSEISSSSARSEPLDPSHISLQKEWGKPIKLNAKDNPLGMAVYKLGGKDGNGAWFARRSVHEGLGFKKWKLGLQREFPETLEVQGGPGEGNIRGIGGERRVERRRIEGAGTIEVYHLSAQFPGPTTPRDFVTLLLTSSSALSEPQSLASRPSSSASDGAKSRTQRYTDTPRHFMVISKPCRHPDCPPRDGFIRGQYESVEFIREIPRKSKKASSTTDLLEVARPREHSPPLEKELLLRNADRKLKESGKELLDGDGQLTPAAADEVAKEGRKRGKTISFAGSRGASAKGEAMDDPDAHDDAELNPVEWIMITRSDPGGSVPRFMVERGTPGSIVADASKFLDWACKKEHPQDEVEALENGDLEHVQRKTREGLEAYDTNGHLAGLDGEAYGAEAPSIAVPQRTSVEMATAPAEPAQQGGLVATVANAAYAGLESYAPQAVIDRLPSHPHTQSMQSIDEVTSIPNGISATLSRTVSSASSVASFASAEDHFDDTLSAKSATSQTRSSNSKDIAAMSPHEKELAKLNERKKKLDENLAKAREKELKDKEELTSKEEERIKRAEEKHAKEVAKQEEKYKKEVAKLEAKRQKEATKAEERKRKEEDKDEKRRLTREKDEMKQALEVVSKERDILREQVGALQRENTGLVLRLGKMDEGKELLKEAKKETEEGGRSRSGSLRREKGPGVKGKEATVLAGEKLVDGETTS